MIIAKLSAPLSRRQQTLLDRLNRVIRENITGIRVIRAFQKDEAENQRFEAVDDDYRRTSTSLFKLMSFTDPVFFFFLNAMMLVIFWMASHMIGAGTLQVGQLVAFGEYQFHAMYSMMLFSMVFVMYPRAAISAKRIQDVMDVVPSVEDYPNLEHHNQVPSIVFDHVSFRYPDGESAVLKDISFEVNEGETVAFIGSTGSGKSTLAKLLVRFFDVSSGEIKINGADIRSYDLKHLRNLIGYTPQKANLFSGTIKDNILFGNEHASDEEVVRASKLAEAYSFIMETPLQFNEPVSEGGNNFSGGQKQRISIARALVRKADFYLFDDSFSALDYRTDAKVRKNLTDISHSKIMLIVAQRVASIMHADQIIVLHEGEIVGKGKHETLIKSCQVYREIAESQLSEEELARYE